MKFVTKWKDSNGDYRSEELVMSGSGHTWMPRLPIPFGDITREVTIPKQDGECIHDLQDGSLTCYSADKYKTDKDEVVIHLVGNGWAEELGYPYSDKYRGYPMLAGKTCKKFLEFAAKEMFCDWSDLYSGDINDLVLNAERVVDDGQENKG